MTLVLIDPPSPFAPLATWQRHLAYVRRLPPDTLLRSELIEEAISALRASGAPLH